MGGTGDTLEAARVYSNVVSTGALAFWLLHTLGSIVRGTGNMLLPAAVIIAGGIMQLTLSPALIIGWGPFPRRGVAGAGVAGVTSFSLGSLLLLGYLLSGRSLRWRRPSKPAPGGVSDLGREPTVSRSSGNG